MAQSQYDPHQEGQAWPLQGQEAFADRFFALVHESADLFWLLAPDGSMRDAKSSWCIFTGQQTSQSQGKGWLDALHPADRPQIEHLIQQAIIEGGSQSMECHLRRADRAYRLIHLHAVPVRLRDGTVHEVIACGKDITKQEQSGQMSEAAVQLALKASGVGMWDWDLVTGQIYWTAQGKDLLGWSPTTPSTHECFLMTVYPEDREPVERFLARVVAEHTDYRTEYRVLWPDGSIHWLAERGHCISDSQGHPTHILGVIIEMTKLKQPEEGIETILASITNAVAHVDRQWCYTYVNSRVEEYTGQSREALLGKSFWTDLSECLANSARQVDVQTHLINDLLDVSRVTAKTLKLELERCDLVSLVRETVEDLRVTVPEHSLVLELPEHVVANVLADQARIGQVVTNYVTNALRYSPTDQPVRIGLTLQENMARVWVRDWGPGLSKEAQKEIWQCFHQAKEVPVQSGSGKGLGLGLYICQMLIAEHQGEVGVESVPGEGSNFWFALPLTT